MSFITLSLLSFIGALISGFVGMAGGVFLFAGMTAVLPYQVVIPLHGITQLFSNFSRVVFLRQHIMWSIVRSFFLGSIIGAFCGYWLLKQLVASPQYLLLVVVFLLLYVAFKPKSHKDLLISTQGFFFLGIIIAAISLLVGAIGPFLSPFFYRRDLSKEKIVATISCCQAVAHLWKLPIFFMLDFPFIDYVEIVIVMIVCAIIGSKVGTILLKKLDHQLFFNIIRVIMVIVALRLSIKIFIY